MRWPLMFKSTHETEVDRLNEVWQEAVDIEYARAMTEGRAQVRTWAVDANFNVFNHGNPRGAAYAAFQEAIHMFAPDRTEMKEATDAVTRP